MSFRKKHIKNRIQKIKPKKSIFKEWRFWIVILFLAIILAGFYSVFFWPGFQLKNIEISGNNKISSQELQSAVLSSANESIFFVDTGKISKEILEKFPAIEKVSVNKKFPQTLVLSIAERKSIGAFCQNSGQCFLIDQNGIIFEPISTAPENETIVRQTAETGQVFTGGQAVAESITIAIYKVQKNLKDNFQIDLSEALILSPVKLDVKTNENWQIYFDLSPDADINLQLTKLNLLLNSEISPESRKNLRYINLIPKDRAIICDNSDCGGQ